MSETQQLNTVENQSTVVTPMQLLQVATQQGADIDKLEKLMDMQMRWEANEAKKAFVDAMSKFRSKCPGIVKTRMAHNSKYAGLAETLKQIKEIMEECGLSNSWTTDQRDGLVSVTCNITHIKGHSESTTLIGEPDKSGSKNSIQAIGSTVTYLQRYTLFSILGIASTDQDDDGDGGNGYITEEQVKELRKLIQDTKSDVAKFLKFAKADKLDEILMSNYGKCVAALQKKTQEAKK